MAHMKDRDTGSGQRGGAPAEIEIKLFVPPASVDRVWTQRLVVDRAIGPRKVERLTNRYFDTPRRELAGRRMALRLRGDGATWVQTLKTGGAGHGALSQRGEWEEPVDGPGLDWTKLAATPLADFVGRPLSRKRLKPIFTTDFERASQRLRLPDGSEVEFAFDRGTIVAGDAAGSEQGASTGAICEIEIELKRAGSDEPEVALLRFAAHLARSLPLIPLGASKAARGYAVVDGLAADATKATKAIKATLPRPLTGDAPAVHLARVLTACSEAVLVNAHALFDGETAAGERDSVAHVHQARVAIRRMRSAIRLFRPAVDGRRLRAVDERLQAIGRVFGTVRDADVFMTTTMGRLARHVGSDAEGREALDAIRGDLEARRAAARRALMDALDVGVFGATMIEVERLAHRLASDDATGPTIGACAARWLPRQYARVVERARRLADLDQHERHRLRIEVKRLRYALDLLEALFDDEAVAAFRAVLARLQDRLGKLNDEAVAGTVMRTSTPGPALDLVLARDEAWFARRLLKQLPKVAAEAMGLELTLPPWTIERAVALR